MSEFDEIIKSMDKKYGAGSVWYGSDIPQVSYDAVSTGSPALDRATGVGGIPLGKTVEIYGPESSGKSTLSIHIMTEAQRLNLTAAYIDAEHALDARYAANCGLNLDSLLISQPDSAEMGLGIACDLTESGKVKVVVVDSVAALVPQDEIDKDLDEATVALQARLMSRTLRKITPVAARTGTALIFINQIRDNVRAIGNASRSVTPGGRALKFYSSIRIELAHSEQIKHREEVIGSKIRARIRKNKVARPFQVAQFPIIFGEGISKELETMDIALKAGIITRRGSNYYFEDQSIGVGSEQVRKNLIYKPEIFQAVQQAIEADI